MKMRLKCKQRHKGVVGFEYVIILIIMSVALYGTFSGLSNTLKAKGIDLAEFINNNGQSKLGSKNKSNSGKDYRYDWITGTIEGWRGASEVKIIKGGYYFEEAYNYNPPEYVYAWKNHTDDYFHENFTKDDHLISGQGKDGYYYIIDPQSSTDPSKFKNVKKYKYTDIFDRLPKYHD